MCSGAMAGAAASAASSKGGAAKSAIVSAASKKGGAAKSAFAKAAKSLLKNNKGQPDKKPGRNKQSAKGNQRPAIGTIADARRQRGE